MPSYTFDIFDPDALELDVADGNVASGDRFRIRPDWSNSADATRLAITDDGTGQMFSGDDAADEVGTDGDQTATATEADGNVVSGNAYIENAFQAVAPDGSTTTFYLVEIDGFPVGYVTDAPVQPGVTYEAGPVFDVHAGNAPDYADLVSADHEPGDADLIEGGQYADSIEAGAGNDTIVTGAGNDTVYGDDGSEYIDLGDGDDSVVVTDGAGDVDTVEGGAGQDRMWLWGQSSTDGAEIIHDGDASGTYTFTGTGASGTFSSVEEIQATYYDDTIDASADSGGVFLGGRTGDDLITGGSGDDTIIAGPGDDTVDAGAGDDILYVRENDDQSFLDGGDGWDRLRFGDNSGGNDGVAITHTDGGSGSYSYRDGGSTGTYTSFEQVQGTKSDDTIDASGSSEAVDLLGESGDDSITGGTGDDTLRAGMGDDTLVGGDGEDFFIHRDDYGTVTIDGGAGWDRLSLEGWNSVQDGVILTLDGIGEGDGTFTYAESGASGSFSSIRSFLGSHVDDTIDASATTTHHYYRGNDGDDRIIGGSGRETIDGDAGADTVTGGDGDDSVRLGSGDDSFGGYTGEAGADTIDGGAGADTIIGGAGDDLILGGDGDDMLVGGTDSDTVQGGAGDDTIFVTDNHDATTVDGGDGTDQLYLGRHASTLEAVSVTYSGAGAGSFDFVETGGAGAFSSIEYMKTTSLDDTVDATAATDNQHIYVDAGDDSVIGGSGHDTIEAGWGADTVRGGAGNDSILAGDGDDLVEGGDGADTIRAEGGRNTIDGGAGDDEIHSGTGNDSVALGTGEDDYVLSDGFGDDTVDGGADADEDDIDAYQLSGAVTVVATGDREGTLTDGSDTVTFRRIDDLNLTNHDDVVDLSQSNVGMEVDTFSGRDTIVGSAGDDHIEAGGQDDSVSGGTGADTIEGGDGSDTLRGDGGDDSIDGGDGGDDLRGGAGDDTISAGLGRDTIWGNDGNNLLIGGATQDVFYSAGSDTILAGDGDDIVVMQETTENVSVDGEAGDEDYLVIHRGFSTDAVTFTLDSDESGQMVFTATGGTTTFTDIERLEGSQFGDTVDASLDGSGLRILGHQGDDLVYGGTGNDTIEGGTGADTLSGGDGDDYIDGGDGDDVLTTGTGNDTLIGGAGNDTLQNSSGDDSLVGGTGDDSIVATEGDDTLEGGDGNDTLFGGADNDSLSGGAGDDVLAGGTGADSMSGGDDADTFVLEDGFGADTIDGGEGGDDRDVVDLSQLTGPVTVRFSGPEAGTFTDGTDTVAFSGIERFILTDHADTIDARSASDGIDVDLGAGDDSITDGSGDDVIVAGDGDDYVAANDGQDTIIGGAGDDEIEGGDGADSISGDEGNDFLAGYDVNGLSSHVLSIDPGWDDGSADTISGGTGDDTILGGGGADSLSGGDDADTFVMADGFGADTIDGGEGGDDRDVIDLSQVTGPVTVTFTGAEAGTFTDGTDTVAFSGIERFILTDQADVVDASNDTAGIEIVAGDGNDHVTGGTGDDTIAGDQGDDTISGGDGHDTIRGDRGADSIDGGDGDDSLAGGLDDDTLEGGLGDDTLNGGGGADGLVGGAGRDSIEGSSGNDTIRAGDGDDVVKGGNDDDVIFGGAGADRMQGDDGADSLSGDDGDDTISGGEGADTLSGEEGADSLDGGSGGDVLAGGAGNDEITTGDGEDIVMLDVGGGDDVITDFDLGDDDGNGSFNDQLDVSALRDLNGDPIRAFDVTVTDDGFGNARLVFPAGESVVLRGVAPAQMSSASQMNAAGVPCFTAGTLIDTPTGPRPVDALRPGDLVETVDDGPQPVIWQATHTIAGDVLRGNPRLRPVRIEVGAFGNDRPLLVSPQHGILLRDDDGREALIRATHLARLDDGTATTPPVTGPVTYVHVMLARHQVLISHGMRSESFYPGPWALRGLDPVTRAHLLAIFPALAEVAVDVAYGPTARPFLTWQELLALRMPGASMIPRQMPNATPDHRPAWLPAAAWSIRTNRATPAIRPGDPEPQVSMCRTRTSGRGSTAPDEPFLGAIGR